MLNSLRLALKSRRTPATRVLPTGVAYNYLTLRHQQIKADSEPITISSERKRPFSERFFRFIRSETKILSDSLNIDANLSPKLRIPPNKIDPTLHASLTAEPDLYHQFVTALRSPKFSIHPDALMVWYRALPAVEDSERQILLKRLIFHCQWHHFWKVAITDATTLNDVEDIIDLLQSELEANHNYTFGVWEVIRAAFRDISTSSLLSSILESIGYKFRISRSQITSFYDFVCQLEKAESVSELHRIEERRQNLLNDNLICRAYFWRKLLEMKNFLNCDIVLKRELTLLKTPGWYSFLAMSLENEKPSITVTSSFSQDKTRESISHPAQSLSKLFLHYRSAKLNETDLVHLIQGASGKEAHQVLLLTLKNNRKGRIINQELLARVISFTLAANDISLTVEVIKKLPRCIPSNLWTQLFPQILEHDPPLLRRALKKSTDLQEVLSDSDFLTKTLLPRHLSLLISNCGNHRDIIRSALKANWIDRESAVQLLRDLSNTKLTTYNLMELLRFAFRHRITDDQSFVILDKIFERAWRIKNKGSSIDSLSQQRSEKKSRTFILTKGDRANLNHLIRTLGNSITLLPAEEISAFFNAFRRHIDLDDSRFPNLVAAKPHILERLIRETFRFIHKHDASKANGVKTIKKILDSLDFASSAARSSTFEFAVSDNPRLAFEILTNSRFRKSTLCNTVIEGIALGLLRSKQLNTGQRCAAFESFWREAKKYGFKHEPSPRNLVAYFHTVFRSPRDQYDETTLKRFVGIAHEQGIPLSVIKGWSKQVKRRSHLP